MKKSKIVPILLSALLLTACQPAAEPVTENTGTSSGTVITPPPETTSATQEQQPETSQTAAQSLDAPLYDKDYFLGLTSEKIYYKDASKIKYGEKQPTLDEVIENNYRAWWTYDGWSYASLPCGIALNSIDNEYDTEKGEFVGVQIPDNYEYNYFAVHENDEFGGLTVNHASITLFESAVKQYPNVVDMQIGFSGEKTVTGYITAQVFEEGYMREGNIYFRFDEGQWDDMPILVSQSDNGHIPSPVQYDDGSDSGFYYQSDTPLSNFGSILTDYPDIDLSAIPLDGSWAHVKVTITDIFMDNAENREYIPLSAKIVNIEEIQ